MSFILVGIGAHFLPPKSNARFFFSRKKDEIFCVSTGLALKVKFALREEEEDDDDDVNDEK